MKVNITIKSLEKLLREAKTAHGAYERKLGRSHSNWPRWYASYILKELSRQH